MFSQEESALSRARGGLGIGLALTRKLVELHGGTVTASSEGHGKGSVFTVRLPLAVPVPHEAPEDPAGDVEAAATAGSLRILVADDNADAAETLSILVESLGHSVHRVGDGEAAIGAALSFDPELVLLDIGMPKVNGYDACRRIRTAPGGTSRTLVAITGWGQPQDLER